MNKKKSDTTKQSPATHKIGDVVQLNSGGPHLTVTYFDSTDDETRVAWIDGSGKQYDSFPGVCLTKVSQ